MRDSFEDHLGARLRARFYPQPESVAKLEESLRQVSAGSARTTSRFAVPGGVGVLVVIVVALVLVSGLQRPSVPVGPAASASAEPTRASHAAAGPDDLVLMRTSSGPFDHPSERTIDGFPNIAIFGSGLVVARDPSLPIDQRPSYRALQLDAPEWQGVLSAIAAANLTELEIDADPRGCFSAGTVIYSVAAEGGTFKETIAPCLFTVDGLAPPDPAIYGQGLVDLDAVLHRLIGQVVERGTAWGGDVPTVRIAPSIEG
jgi:hypothetical protein